MADVFISYARSTEAVAQRIAETLKALGYVVWRDDDLPAHRAYGEVIEERLRAAKVVLAVWSLDAARSQWVRAEADLARNAGKLVQLSLDETVPPLPFNQIQCANLVGWTGGTDHPGWSKVLDSIAEIAGPPRRSKPTAPVEAPAESEIALAVLAFDNLSGDPEMGYFSDGVSEEILQAVARLKTLKVIGRSSSFQFRGGDKAAAHVAARLNVSHVLDGSVRRSGARVRIAASLVECATETSLWSDRFDRDLADVFALQDEIAAATADALAVIFAPKPRPAVDPAAYDAYLRARALPSTVSLSEKRIALLEQVVAGAPEFAPAWSELAVTLARSVRWRTGRVEGADLRQAAKVAALKAITLDPDLGSPYAALSLLEPGGRYDAQEGLLNKARDLDGEDVGILGVLADFYFSVGRLRDSFEVVEAGLRVDPLNPTLTQARVTRLLDLERFDEGFAGVEAALAIWPEQDWLVSGPMILAAARGEYDRADRLFSAFDRIVSPFKGPIARHYELVRHPDEAARDEAQTSVLRRAKSLGRVDLSAVLFLQAIGRQDAAFDLFESGDWSRLFGPSGDFADPVLTTGILFDALHAPLRLDPRFPSMCGRLGLCAYWIASGRWPDCADDIALPYDFREACRRWNKDHPIETYRQ
jgi:TolB-like protein